MITAILLEVIRHRLSNINEDAASILRRVSGSQIAVEANDLNTVIMMADGRVIACGRYVLIQTASMQLLVDDIVANYSTTPGFEPGDQFITNDPYIATLHQPDVILAAPIFHNESLVGWCASVVHQSDVGGPTPGGISYDAQSIFDEAIPMAPMKIVEHGRIRRDIEREYLIRSRTPELNALDLAGQIAANRETILQVQGLCDRYGSEVYVEALRTLIENARRDLSQRLRALPDGIFRHRAYVTHRHVQPTGSLGDDIYAVRLTMTKRDDRLALDFSESDSQAPGAINTTRPAMVNFALGALLIYLCNDLPWIPGALWTVVDIHSKEGTVTHARWPAGVAMSTSATGQAIRVCVNACVARLLETDPEFDSHLMASCQFAGAGACVISGESKDGGIFATMTTDDMSGGGGGRVGRDGADSSGFTTSPGASISNVEVSESYLPLRYLSRRELINSGGAGRWRGGVGTMQFIAPHRDPKALRFVSFGQGLQYPPAIGICGGSPGSSSGFALLPEMDYERLAREGIDAIVPMPSALMMVSPTQMVFIASQGGGGLGEPLDREPAAVLDDVREGLVSLDAARDIFGVLFEAFTDFDAMVVDERATFAQRAHLRRLRLGGREPLAPRPVVGGVRISWTIEVTDGRSHCRRCSIKLCVEGEDLWSQLIEIAHQTSEFAPHSLLIDGSTRFVVRYFHCPGCAQTIDVQVTRTTERPLIAFERLG